jgi:predicted ATP-dependent endonuclease of OLD family
MKLEKVNISNYRSIENEKIEFSENALFLFGKNENGKSNILRALAQLEAQKSDELKYVYMRDMKRRIGGEIPLDKTKIEFIFSFTKPEKEKIYQEFVKESGGDPLDDVSVVDLLNFTHLDVVFGTGSEREAGHFINWNATKLKFKPNYFLVVNLPKDKKVTLKGKTYERGTIKWFDKNHCNNFQEIESFIKPIDKELFVDQILGRCFWDYTEINKPKIIYWKYSESNLITKPINIEDFVKAPDNFIPLRNIFRLAGYRTNEQIKLRVEQIKNDPFQTSYKSLKRQLSEKVTSHIREIWKDNENIFIDVDISASTFNISVRDGKDGVNDFPMQERSDGAKRFLSFLLTISADYQNKQLENNLILLDEPEQSLHPSSTKYVRDELIKMSDKNLVVVSSHSIFMVDKMKMKRNLIVEKDNENTRIKETDEDNFIYEEVIYRAMGTSLFEIFKERNVLFEGDDDRQVFQMLNGKLKEYGLESLDFDSYGQCCASGVNKFHKFLDFFEGLHVKFIGIADYDDEGRKVIEELKNKGSRFSKSSFTYELINTGKKNFTLEDFLPDKLFIDLVNRKITSRKGMPQMVALDEKRSNLEMTLIFLQKNGLRKEESKAEVEYLKSQISHELKKYLKSLEEAQFSNEFVNFINFVKKLNAKISVLNKN